ncbi:MAG TPA: hypothetical protein VLY04_10790 [Bryobacteraceae bacterium]|nr:hypothetical protein [Bryobacteraceae bacterium]
MPTKLKREVITAAIQGFESQKSLIDTQIAELRAMLDGRTVVAPTDGTAPRKRRKMSAAARRRIAEAQRKRWAAAKKQSGAKPAAPKRKRRLSAAGRQRIIEATKKRWALVRARKRAGSARKPAAKQAAPAAS